MLINPNTFQQPADYIGEPLKKGKSNNNPNRLKGEASENKNLFFFTREQLIEYFNR